eukprot:Nitzschia sp. Nitz4//scaffold41_size133979//48401//50269//NITZ4_003341-RA/size133979-processed-gene-0.215-mRNA-1//1//CDS//3329551452//9165//frame0
MMDPLSLEAEESRALHVERLEQADRPGRRLKKHKKDKKSGPVDLLQMEHDQAEKILNVEEKKKEKDIKAANKAHKKLIREMYANPGIQKNTVHGMMIDAGSTGSRLHIFEWEPRMLHNQEEVEAAVAGRKLSYPESTSRWTDRLRPGIATYASLSGDELRQAIADYLSPLLDFSRTVLREKEDQFHTFPIFFRATAGMRILDKADRSRVLGVIRDLFANETFSPFYFEDEHARILSGEEEAIFGWTAINFVMGNLVEESEGAGTVLNPKKTYGALDMGGASTQISFYEPNEDIMANLFKLQIGQGKHWNLYAHSFLYYGLNEARDRFQARLLNDKDEDERLVQGVNNPCLPGNSRQEVRLNIHFDASGEETWNETAGVDKDGYYHAVLLNDQPTANFDLCMEHAKMTLHLDKNGWCEFAHKGECAFNGVAMSELPMQSESFGEFLAFSNFYHVWHFLGLPERSSLQTLYDATKEVCSLHPSELKSYGNLAKGDPEDIQDICFRSAYVFNLLHHGYGFEMDEYITATNVLNGQKVGWAVGAMLYEINTIPWEYSIKPSHIEDQPMEAAIGNPILPHAFAAFVTVAAVLGVLMSVFVTLTLQRRRRQRQLYEPIKSDTTLPKYV